MPPLQASSGGWVSFHGSSQGMTGRLGYRKNPYHPCDLHIFLHLPSKSTTTVDEYTSPMDGITVWVFLWSF